MAGILASARAADWPQWGGRNARNMVSPETRLPSSFDARSARDTTRKPDPTVDGTVRWMARLGKQSYGTPTVAGGRVFVGTNNGHPRIERYQGDRGILLCLDEATGKLLWQLTVAKLPRTGSFHGDLDRVGFCSSATVEGDRAYVVSSDCAVLCLDVKGLADGNDGPFQDEGEYVALGKRHKPGIEDPDRPETRRAPQRAEKPLPLLPTDADIIWRFDMIEKLDVWPHATSNGSVLLHGDLLFTSTSNGVDTSNLRVACPQAPALIALNKHTGQLVAREDAQISQRIFHGTWSSPSLATVGGQELLFLGGPDGVCYAFDPKPVPVAGRPVATLKLVWACDVNPPALRLKGGQVQHYTLQRGKEGPSEVIGTPVCHEGRVYTTIGRDPTYGLGPGALTCIDATQRPDPEAKGKTFWTRTGMRTIPSDVTSKAVVWQYTAMRRSTSTPAVADGLVYVVDFAGDVHCVDALTGKPQWVYPTKRITLGSAYVADGKVFVGNQRGYLHVLAAGRTMKLLRKTRLRSPIDCTPVVANGVLYVATARNLFAIGRK